MAQSNLKLVQPAKGWRSESAAHQAHPRPWRTFYYTPRSALHEWCRIGRAASIHGAIRAATGHLLRGVIVSARICDEGGLEVAHLIRVRNRITIKGVF